MKSARILVLLTGVVVMSGIGFVVYDLWDDFAGKSLVELWNNGSLMVLLLVAIPLVIGAILSMPLLRSVFPHYIPNGVTTSARVVEVWDTGATVNMDPMIGLLLEFSTTTGALVHVKTRTVVPRLNAPLIKPSTAVEILYDPEKPTRFTLVRFDLAAPDDSVSRMHELDRLFQGGMITEAEYQQKRAEILARL